MRSEVLVLWGLLWFAYQLCIEELRVFGDFKVLIDYLNKGKNISPGHLETWLVCIEMLRNFFTSISFKHIFREKNSQVDRLSKKGLNGEFGLMFYELYDSSGEGAEGMVQLP